VFTVLPDRSGGHLGCRRGRHLAARTQAPKRKCLPKSRAISAGQDARLYGRQDACRYGKHIPRERAGVRGNRAEPIPRST